MMEWCHIFMLRSTYISEFLILNFSHAGGHIASHQSNSQRKGIPYLS